MLPRGTLRTFAASRVLTREQASRRRHEEHNDAAHATDHQGANVRNPRVDKRHCTIRALSCGTISRYVETEGCVIETTRQARAHGWDRARPERGGVGRSGCVPRHPLHNSFVCAGRVRSTGA